MMVASTLTIRYPRCAASSFACFRNTRLFEPFHRLETGRLSASAPGAGLGLSIVQSVARAHGGDVHAEPRDGGGLVVTVTLPAATP